MSLWKPDLTTKDMEEKMESQDVPEEDRDEVRRFAEFLKRRADKKAGKELEPMTEEMKKWLLGED